MASPSSSSSPFPPPNCPNSNSLVESSKPVLRRKRSSFADVVKLVVLGAKSVGKSAVIVRYLTKRFIGEYDHATDNKYRHSEVIETDQVLIEVVDTICGGHESNDRFTKDDNLRWGDGFILIYSITDRESFEFLENIRTRIVEIKKHNNSQLPVLVLGNKSDLEYSRVVTREEGQTYAATHGFLFEELSASENPEKVRSSCNEICKEIFFNKRRSRGFLDRVLGQISGKKHEK